MGSERPGIEEGRGGKPFLGEKKKLPTGKPKVSDKSKTSRKIKQKVPHEENNPSFCQGGGQPKGKPQTATIPTTRGPGCPGNNLGKNWPTRQKKKGGEKHGEKSQSKMPITTMENEGDPGKQKDRPEVSEKTENQKKGKGKRSS